MNHITLRVKTIILLAILCTPCVGKTIYVDGDAKGANDGSNWTNAYCCLQNALAFALYGDEIRVANGIYKPDRQFVAGRFNRIVASGDRTATFQLIDGVTLKGGYAGFGAPDPDARDIELYETILSGDLNGNDGPNFSGNSENSFHVMTGSNTTAMAILDGFTITAGNANDFAWPNDCAGGMRNVLGHPTVVNCTFSGNEAKYSGGMDNIESNPTLVNCIFKGNWAEFSGGGMQNNLSNPTLTNCSFSGNAADDWGGGGMENVNSSPILTNCTFSGNSTGDSGGGMRNIMSSPTLTDCTFHDNLADGWGGGGVYNLDSDPTLTNCTFRGNFSEWGSGGMDNVESNVTLVNCIFRENSTGFYGGGMSNSLSNLTLTDCIFSGNQAEHSGGGMTNSRSDLTLTNCRFNDNLARKRGGAMSDTASNIILHNCTFTFSKNSPLGIYMYDCSVDVVGTVEMACNNWSGSGVTLAGDGEIYLQPDAGLAPQREFRIRCNVSGAGSFQVGPYSELMIEGIANINMLGDRGVNGRIQCDGLLRVGDHAQIRNTTINVTRASFEDDADITNSVIHAEAGAPYGQFFVEDTVNITNNEIHADGDRYMDLDPSVFAGVVQNNRIYVTITEGQGSTRGGLLELRGKDFEVPPCASDDFFCFIDRVPDFDLNTWTIEELKLVEGAKVNLTNRFDFGNGGPYEVMYVKQLVLGHNSVLNTAFNRLYYESIDKAETATIKNVPYLGFSLNNIACDDETEFIVRIKHNNFEDIDFNSPDYSRNSPDYSRFHVERITGQAPDPKGMIRMRNLREQDPNSPQYENVIHARAKGLFAKASEDRILIMFEYLFETSEPGVELVVYLSDVPELLDHSDPSRAEHYLEVARLPAPPRGRPGSAGSGRFGIFQQTVSAGSLNFTRGTRIELELIGSDGTQVFIDDWDPQVHCTGICMDLNWSDVPDEEDFLIVIGECGKTAKLLPDATNSRACLDGVFSDDGFVDLFDIFSFDWALSDPARSNLLHFCSVPLTQDMSIMGARAGSSAGRVPLQGVPQSLSDLLILGKRSTSNDPEALKSKDRLYTFSRNGQFTDWSDPEVNRGNIKLVNGPDGKLYLINSEMGVFRLDETDVQIIPPGQTTYMNEPRYNRSATVSIGVQNQGANPFGRPILDAAFDDQYVYVVPVVVDPGDGEAYAAAAKLELSTASPPYRIVQLYDDPPPLHDNQYRNNLREIEIDEAGNLYVLNVHSLNESDMLWKYGPDGSLLARLELGCPDTGYYLPDPIAMHVSDATERVYLASAQYEEDSYSTTILGFSQAQLVLEKSMTIGGMQHVTDVTEDPATGALWVVGFTMENIPEYPDPTQSPFYYPCLAKIPSEGNNVQVMSLLGPSDLGLPLSIVWTAAIDR